MQAYLGIDAGKTNLRVGVFNPDLKLLDRWSVNSPDVSAVQEALRNYLLHLNETLAIAAVGLSTFGPLQVNPTAANYGAIPESSDPAWTGINLPALLSATLRKPVFFDYDVNAGALAEATFGAGQGCQRSFYLSIGTGIGGVLFHNRHTPGYAPQVGHNSLPREPDDQIFAGSCRFHGPCLQGLASGRAIEQRWGAAPETLDPGHPAWDLEARYLARACANLIYSFSPERIVLGSSVSAVPGLVQRINDHLPRLLNGFLEPDLLATYTAYPPVVQATLTPQSSLIGAALLARDGAGLLYPCPSD